MNILIVYVQESSDRDGEKILHSLSDHFKSGVQVQRLWETRVSKHNYPGTKSIFRKRGRVKAPPYFFGKGALLGMAIFRS